MTSFISIFSAIILVSSVKLIQKKKFVIGGLFRGSEILYQKKKKKEKPQHKAQHFLVIES